MAVLPTKEELETFDKYKVVAYAARCAMRAFAFWEGKEEHTNALKRAIKLAGEFAADAADSNAYIASTGVSSAVASAADAADARAVAYAADAVHAAIACASASDASGACVYATDAASACSRATNAAAYATNAANAAAYADFEKLKALPDGPLNCGPRGPLGPVWPDWKPDGWDESKLDFIYENGDLEPEVEDSSKHSLELEFKVPKGWTIEDVIEKVKDLSGDIDIFHRSLGGKGLTVSDIDVHCEIEAEVKV